jgi:hypothetical protein
MQGVDTAAKTRDRFTIAKEYDGNLACVRNREKTCLSHRLWIANACEHSHPTLQLYASLSIEWGADLAAIGSSFCMLHDCQAVDSSVRCVQHLVQFPLNPFHPQPQFRQLRADQPIPVRQPRQQECCARGRRTVYRHLRDCNPVRDLHRGGGRQRADKLDVVDNRRLIRDLDLHADRRDPRAAQRLRHALQRPVARARETRCQHNDRRRRCFNMPRS